MLLLELRYFGEVELSHLHGWDYHIKRFLAARAHWSSHLLHVRKHVNQALVEAKIAHAVANLAVFYVKGTVASHSREDFFVGINFTDVPQPCDQHTAFGRGNHLVHRLGFPGRAKHNVHRRFAHFVGNGKTMAGRLDWAHFVLVLRIFHLLGGSSRIDQPLHHPILHKRHSLATHSLTIERRPRLQRMAHVIPNIDVLAKKLRT